MITNGRMPFGIWKYPDGTTKYNVVDATPEELQDLKERIKPGDSIINGQSIITKENNCIVSRLKP